MKILPPSPLQVDAAAPVAQVHRLPAASTINVSDFKAAANLEQKQAQSERKVLQQRLPPARPTKAARGPSARVSADEEDLQARVVELLDGLSGGHDRDALERDLEERYDALERYTLLSEARAVLEGDPGAGGDVAARLDSMLAELEAGQGAAFGAGRRSAAELEVTLGLLDDGTAATLPQLRLLYGAKGCAGMDAPLMALALFESLLARQGAARLDAAMRQLRGTMARELHHRRGAGPRLWLSLSDAASFNVMQSCFSMAADLRAALAEQAAVTPAADQAGTTLMLLTAGQAKAEHMLAGIAGNDKLAPFQEVAACRLLRELVQRLPPALWHGDAAPQRLGLVAQFDARLDKLAGALPAVASRAELLEARLRTARRAPG